MIKRSDTITVFGGSGFIGKYVVKELAKTGAKIKVIGKHATTAAELRTTGAVGQISLIEIDIHDRGAITEAINGSKYVVNLVGILFEKKATTFDHTHIRFASTLAELCFKQKIERLVHISALGVDKSKASSIYAKTKFEAEKEVLKFFPNATIIRPSVVFGAEDNFINLFNWISKISLFLPLIGGGHTLFQPVYVGDIARFISRALETSKSKVCGKVFELGGPHQYTFKEIMQLILSISGRKRLLVPIPVALANMKAYFFEFMPKPILTRDQVRLLEYNNIVSKENGLETLGINPTAMEAILPSYVK
jgi:NADH dehydrogenase